MPHRLQRTISRSVATSGIGFLTGADIALRFLPAPADYGIAFQRTDCADSPPIPAVIENTVPRQRRTAIAHQGVAVEMVEHVMAALAGLQIDNCLVQLDGPEPPGFDGSSRALVDCLSAADIVEQNALRRVLVVGEQFQVGSDDGRTEVSAAPLAQPVLAITYHLDYGPRSPVPAHSLTVEISPESFLSDLAYARTFVLDSEVEALRAQGYGRRTTPRDLLVFGSRGVIDNELRAPDECARHKILDCLGDFALIGCDLCGHFTAYRSGHQLNRDIIRLIKNSGQQNSITERRAA
jgi:UDP-3-O-[3-hydroxymyristoyl] N-acetylglucosamine deacetylase